MNGISNVNTSLYLGAEALRVHSVGMQVTAHNIANVNTADFTPQQALYATGPRGQGVALDAVIPAPGEKRGAAGIEALPETGLQPEFARPSGTELAREMPRMLTTEHAFNANAQTISTADEMLGTLLNIKA